MSEILDIVDAIHRRLAAWAGGTPSYDRMLLQQAKSEIVRLQAEIERLKAIIGSDADGRT